MSDFKKVVNIGDILARRLNDIGILNIDDLRTVGSREAFLRLKLVDPTTCVNTLFALEGAIQNIRWHHLDEESKSALKSFFTDTAL